MMRSTEAKRWKRILWLLLAVWGVQIAQAGVYQHGTVVKMRMGDCAAAPHGFMLALGGAPSQMPVEACPEYTLVSDKVVYVIVGRSSNQLVPLADVIDFRIQKNELAVRVDDAKRESKFMIKEMVLRSEWDLIQKHITNELSTRAHLLENGGIREDTQ